MVMGWCCILWMVAALTLMTTGVALTMVLDRYSKLYGIWLWLLGVLLLFTTVVWKC